MDKKLEINVDLSLYEWMKWSPGEFAHSRNCTMYIVGIVRVALLRMK